MAEAEAQDQEGDSPAAKGKKSGKGGLLAGLALALILGGGAFYAVWSGMILSGAPSEEKAAGTDGSDPHQGSELSALPGLAFVPLAPLNISLAPGFRSDHLRFTAQLEVDEDHVDDVTMLAPRVIDVLNAYLRAVDPETLADPGALTRLRAQMLRRVQIVAGEGRIRDLLIMEFILS